MTAVTINGNAYSDDGTQSRDMRFGGHQTWLLPMLQDTMTEVDSANNAAISADASADAAANSATSASDSAALAATFSMNTNKYPTIRPSLNLDFENNPVMDPRITFTRASNATYTDQDGLIMLAPADTLRRNYDPVTGRTGAFIEEAKTNLLSYSENFDNAIWQAGTGRTFIPNEVESPSGTVTAYKHVANTGSTSSFGAQLVSGLSAGTYSLSFYLKDAGATYVNVAFYSAEHGDCWKRFNLVSGTLDSSFGPTATAGSHSITSVGSGWYRCTFTFTTTGMTNFQVGVRHSSWTGDGIKGYYLWGAQLETGPLSSYIPSLDAFTSRASVATYIGSDGLIKSAAINEARYQYNPLNLKLAPKLLLEAARTNLLKYSEDLAGANWLSAGTLGNFYTRATSAVQSPNGVANASVFVSTATADLLFLRKTGLALTAQTYTLSLYVMVPTQAGITYWQIGADLDDIDNFPTTQAQTVFNQWVRVTLTKTLTTSRTFLDFNFRMNGLAPSTAGVTFHVWGAQLEDSAYPTSYIPTTTTAITRSADVSTSAATTRGADLVSMTGTNFSDWYNQTEGTFVAEFTYGTDLISTTVLAASNTYANAILITGSNSGGTGPYSQSVVGGVAQAVMLDGTAVANTTYRAVVAYKANDFGFSRDGRAVVTDASGTIPSVTQLFIGHVQSAEFFNGNISKISYYPKRLTNLQLQALSTQ